MLPCGKAVYWPKPIIAEPLEPSARNAGRMLPPSSPCVMPSRSVESAALNAAIVMSLACCISAISAGDLIIRQPAVTGVASTTCEAGAACASRRR